jgi:hypothetical protein
MRKPLKHKPEKPRKSAVLRSEIALVEEIMKDLRNSINRRFAR